jgi:peptide-methionine (S)-S-oxide reductase
VGYCGGTTANPSYQNIGNHSETVQVEFYPTIISYEQLLSAFWSGHNATYPAYSAQYRSAIFYTTEQQKKLASGAVQAEEARLGKKIYTDVEPFDEFYIAEDYHQKYYLRQASGIVVDLYAIYPDPADFRDSTAAARLNGYLGGYGDSDILKKNLDSLGLSESGKTALLQRTAGGLAPVCPVIIP